MVCPNNVRECAEDLFQHPSYTTEFCKHCAYSKTWSLKRHFLKTHEGTTIANVPAEILSNVFSYLPRNTHLVKIALVSKKFRDSVEPFLYRSIALKFTPGPEETSNSCRLYRFYRLVESLTQSPHLCRFVVALRLSVYYESCSQALNDHHQLITLLPSLKELTMNPPPPHLSLATCPQLRTLRFDFYNYFEQHGKGIPEQDCVDPLDIVARHFWTPTLQTLQISTLWLHRHQQSQLFPKERYRTSPISDLRVMRCSDLNIDVLASIILSVRVLRRFTLDSQVPPWLGEWGFAGISPKWFAEALQPHESTLVSLIIATSSEAAFLRTPLFANSASYTKLKRLGIPDTFLVQHHDTTFHELLPASLEVLQLQIPSELDIELLEEEQPLRFERMEHLAENKLACLPAFKSAIWWDQYYDPDTGNEFKGDRVFHDRMAQLVGKLKDVGVKLRSCYSKFFAETPMGKGSGGRYVEDAWFD